MSLRRPFALLAVALMLTACAAPGATTRPTGTPAAATPTAAAATPTAAAATPTAAATATAAATPTTAADACAGDLALKNPGRLTLSTDIPAFPPWWGGEASEQYPNEPDGGSEWTSADFSAEPYSMEGFEGATAYAIAEAMGFGADEVDWIANPVFELAFAPGEKPFDFHMAQISITPERAEAVTFTDPYFDSNQSVLALSSNEIRGIATLAQLKAYRLGAAANTTSFDLIENIIAPDVEPAVYPDNSAALLALQNDQIDGLIVDLSTAFFMRDAQLEDFDTPQPEGIIVGQFGPPAVPDQVGAVLELDNALVACVNQAIAQIKTDGTHAEILDTWINTGQEVIFLD